MRLLDELKNFSEFTDFLSYFLFIEMINFYYKKNNKTKPKLNQITIKFQSQSKSIPITRQA